MWAPCVTWHLKQCEFRFKLKQVSMLSLCTVHIVCGFWFLPFGETAESGSWWPLLWQYLKEVKLHCKCCISIFLMIRFEFVGLYWEIGNLCKHPPEVALSISFCLRNCQSLETSNLPPNVQSNLLGWVVYPSKEIALCISPFWGQPWSKSI